MKRLVLYFLLALLVLLTCWSLVAPGMVDTHDYVHAARIAEMGRALQDGHFPVRWSQNFGYGYGMPLFLFYAPLPYYVGALFWLAGVPIVASVKVLYWLVAIGTAWGGYLLGKELYGRLGGILVAASIVMAPYRAVNLYIRGALGETWGIMAGVWVMLGSVLILKRKKYGWLVLALSLVVLFLSHNLMTLILVPFAMLFCVLWIAFSWTRKIKLGKKAAELIKQDSIYYLKQFGLSYLLASMIAAFYLLPAFLEKQYTKIEQAILSGYFDFHLHFLYLRQFVQPGWGYGGSVWGPEDGISFFVGLGQIIGVSLSIILVIIYLWRRRSKFRQVSIKLGLFWTSILLLGLSILLSTQKTLFIWDQIELMRFIQFPWRYLSVTLIFVGILSGYWIKIVPNRLVKILLTIFFFAILIGNFRFFKAEQYLTDPSKLYYADATKIQTHMSGILPDFIPQDLSLKEPPQDLVICEESCAEDEVDVLIDKTHQKLVSVNADQVVILTINLADFPGWQVQIDGEPVKHQTTVDGRIQISVPEGQHLVGVSFESTPIRFWSDIVSSLGLVVLVVAIYWHQDKNG